MQRFVAYFRVSTAKQGASGLGLEAQRSAVEQFVRQQGGMVAAEFVEIESGRKADRPQLRNAIAAAKRTGGTLVIAKLDRLARNVRFLAELLEANVAFQAVDNPHANKLTLHILAAVGQAEAEAISQRTTAALAAYKARGGKLGAARPECRNLTVESRVKGSKVAATARTEAAAEFRSSLLPELEAWRTEGLTLAAIAARLNERGERTRRGKPWTHVAVLRALGG